MNAFIELSNRGYLVNTCIMVFRLYPEILDMIDDILANKKCDIPTVSRLKCIEYFHYDEYVSERELNVFEYFLIDPSIICNLTSCFIYNNTSIADKIKLLNKSIASIHDLITNQI